MVHQSSDRLIKGIRYFELWGLIILTTIKRTSWYLWQSSFCSLL